MHKEYFVVRRGNSEWRVSIAGTSTGPYVSEDVATRVAVDLAKEDLRDRIHAKVYVEEGLLGGLTVVYDSTTGTGAGPNE